MCGSGSNDFRDAIRYFEKATTLIETDVNTAGMLITCYTAVGNSEAALRIAQTTLSRAEKTLAQDPNNGAAMGFGVVALVLLGEFERAKDWIKRALLIDPDNMNMRYNFACALSTYAKDSRWGDRTAGSAVRAKMSIGLLNHAKADPDLDPLRDDPRFKAMMAGMEARIAAAMNS